MEQTRNSADNTSKNSVKTTAVYDDGNIPQEDLNSMPDYVEPLPESSRPRKDGPGGD